MINQPDSSILLSTAYLAPVQYYAKLLTAAPVLIEQHDNFIKQTYRNRCVILSANGNLTLSIPVVRELSHKVKVKDTRIAYDEDWQKIHWRAIESAYRSAPFFEFYADGFEPFYHKKYTFLLDFNMQMQKVVLDYLKIKPDIQLTEDYVFDIVKNDFRDTIHPKPSKHKPDNFFNPEPYQQVFIERFGFQANLSIIDLIFNTGSEARTILFACLTIDR